VIPKIGPEDKQGMPSMHNGNYEHATVIAGYYYVESKLHLIAAQWGDFYDIDFDEMFLSTSQLNKFKSPEHYQKYYPIPGLFWNKKWIQKDQMALACDYICDNQESFKRRALRFLNEVWPKDKEKMSHPPTDDSACLANVLTIIKGDANKIELDEFSPYQIHSEKIQENKDNQLDYISFSI
jgi:hypothetical protein